MCQECAIQDCNCERLEVNTAVAVSISEGSRVSTNCEVQYCKCTQPWAKALLEEPDDEMSTCMVLLAVSPHVEQDEETLRSQCFTVNSDEETQRLTPRKSTRTHIERKRVEHPPMAKKSRSYELEKIRAERVDVKGDLEFLCKWKEYDSVFDSWITQDKLSQAQGLLKEWRAQHPTPKESNPCGIRVTPDAVYTHDPQATDKDLDVTGGLEANPGLDTQMPTSFQPQLETTASRMLRESQSTATAQRF